MDGGLAGLGPQLAVLLLGGLAASVGPTVWARGRRGRELLLRARPGAFAAAVAGLIVVGTGAAIAIGRALLGSVAADPASLSLPALLALGVAVGLPLSVPGLVVARGEAVRRDRERRKVRERVPTKDDRRAYAVDLARQIVDVSPRPRTLKAGISGDGGTVLRFEGDIEADEGERLTAALREDLSDLGFKRVEGARGSKAWWTRV